MLQSETGLLVLVLRVLFTITLLITGRAQTTFNSNNCLCKVNICAFRCDCLFKESSSDVTTSGCETLQSEGSGNALNRS